MSDAAVNRKYIYIRWVLLRLGLLVFDIFAVNAAYYLALVVRFYVNFEFNEWAVRYVPAFFEFAKDKEKSQVKSRNQSFVNKIYDRIPNKPINTVGLKLGKIDYRVMMTNSSVICSKEVSELYDKLNKEYRYMINMKDEHADNMRYIACRIRGEFNQFGYCEDTITDMLVEYLYGKDKRYKQLLWFCYGQYIVNNLEIIL